MGLPLFVRTVRAGIRAGRPALRSGRGDARRRAAARVLLTITLPLAGPRCSPARARLRARARRVRRHDRRRRQHSRRTQTLARRDLQFAETGRDARRRRCVAVSVVDRLRGAVAREPARRRERALRRDRARLQPRARDFVARRSATARGARHGALRPVGRRQDDDPRRDRGPACPSRVDRRRRPRALRSTTTPIDHVPPHRRHVGYVPQDVALFPAPDRAPERALRPAAAQKLALDAVAAMLEIDALLDRGVPRAVGRRAPTRRARTRPVRRPSCCCSTSRSRRSTSSAPPDPAVSRARPRRARDPDHLRLTRRGEVRRLADHVIVLDRGRVVRSGEPADMLT